MSRTAKNNLIKRKTINKPFEPRLSYDRKTHCVMLILWQATWCNEFLGLGREELFSLKSTLSSSMNNNKYPTEFLLYREKFSISLGLC